MPDGSVEAIFEGSQNSLENMLEWCRKGPPGAYVSEIKEKWDMYTGEFDGFEIRYGY